MKPLTVIVFFILEIFISVQSHETEVEFVQSAESPYCQNYYKIKNLFQNSCERKFGFPGGNLVKISEDMENIAEKSVIDGSKEQLREKIQKGFILHAIEASFFGVQNPLQTSGFFDLPQSCQNNFDVLNSDFDSSFEKGMEDEIRTLSAEENSSDQIESYKDFGRRQFILAHLDTLRVRGNIRFLSEKIIATEKKLVRFEVRRDRLTAEINGHNRQFQSQHQSERDEVLSLIESTEEEMKELESLLDSNVERYSKLILTYPSITAFEGNPERLTKIALYQTFEKHKATTGALIQQYENSPIVSVANAKSYQDVIPGLDAILFQSDETTQPTLKSIQKVEYNSNEPFNFFAGLIAHNEDPELDLVYRDVVKNIYKNRLKNYIKGIQLFCDSNECDLLAFDQNLILNQWERLSNVDKTYFNNSLCRCYNEKSLFDFVNPQIAWITEPLNSALVKSCWLAATPIGAKLCLAGIAVEGFNILMWTAVRISFYDEAHNSSTSRGRKLRELTLASESPLSSNSNSVVSNEKSRIAQKFAEAFATSMGTTDLVFAVYNKIVYRIIRRSSRL